MIKISKRLNDIIFVLFGFFIVTNQFAIYTTFRFISYFFFTLMLSLICISYFCDIKKIYKKFLNFSNFILLFISFFLIFFYFQNENNYILKISLYLIIILLISNLIYIKKSLALIFHTILLISVLLLIIGFFGWFYGGEEGAWGKQYIYFGYRYLPGTKNQDCQIFLLGYIISLFFIFFRKNNKIYLILNSLFSVALFLSYSRGYWLIYLVVFLFALLMNIFFRYIGTKKFFTIYLLNFIFIIAIIFALNTHLKFSYPSTQLTLQSQFFAKITSLFSIFNIGMTSIDINSLNNNILSSHLEATSIASLQEKYNQFNSLFKIGVFKNLFQDSLHVQYFESGALFILINYPVIFILYTIYFLKEFLFIFKNKGWHKNTFFFYIIFLTIFICQNIIYNLTLDSVTYLYFLIIVIFKKLLLDKSISRSSL
jgi:hypothetical protein